jgi:HK97 family phage major capsid protein
MTKEVEVKDVMEAFEAFKDTNDKRIKEIEAKGVADPVTEAKLAKIEASLVSHEDANQKITTAAAQVKKAEEDIKSLKETLERVEAKAGRPGAGKSDDMESAEAKKQELKHAFDSWVRKGDGELSKEEVKAINEYKTLFAGNDTLGGYYLAPPTLSTEIIKQVVLQSPVRSIARVTPIGVQSLKIAKRTGTFAATRIGELGTRSETTGYTTGMVEINAPEMFAEVHISTQMIEDQFFDIEAEMSLEFSEQFAVKEGAEFVNGTGVNNQAEGYLTNASVAFGVSGTAATLADANGQADGLISLFYTNLKTAYAKNATWVLNRQTLGSVRKLKDANKQYIWQPGYGAAGALPSTILGAPYVEMPDMPNEGANTFPIAVGDFNKGYRIVDRVMVSVLRDPFTLSSTGQILYRARKRVGGAVVLPEAIVKLKCST